MLGFIVGMLITIGGCGLVGMGLAAPLIFGGGLTEWQMVWVILASINLFCVGAFIVYLGIRYGTQER